MPKILVFVIRWYFEESHYSVSVVTTDNCTPCPLPSLGEWSIDVLFEFVHSQRSLAIVRTLTCLVLLNFSPPLLELRCAGRIGRACVLSLAPPTRLGNRISGYITGCPVMYQGVGWASVRNIYMTLHHNEKRKHRDVPCMRLSLYYSWYYLVLPSLLHPSILCKCLHTCIEYSFVLIIMNICQLTFAVK